MIRPMKREDLPALVALYAELDRVDPARPTPGYTDFFARTLFDDPELTDLEVPSYVHEDADRGVVGVIGCHPRRYLLDGKPLRLACAGPLIVHQDFRPKGLGATLLRRYVGGVQEMSFNDRSIDSVHAMWRAMGGVSDALASIEWTRVLVPAGYATEKLGRKLAKRGTPPGGALVARVGGRIGHFGPPAPQAGSSEPLEHGALVELLESLGRQYRLRPDYTPGYLDSIYGLMAKTVLGDRVVRRLVRDDGGRAIGAYVMIVAPHGTANVLNLPTSYRHSRTVLEHLFGDAAAAGAVQVAGRCDPAIQAELGGLGCRLRQGQWVTVRSNDQALVDHVLSGRGLVPRMEGEWWMRPDPAGRGGS
jgi:hypothetical protein